MSQDRQGGYRSSGPIADVLLAPLGRAPGAQTTFPIMVVLGETCHNGGDAIRILARAAADGIAPEATANMIMACLRQIAERIDA